MRCVAIARRLAVAVDHRRQVPRQRRMPARQMSRIVVRQRANDRQTVSQLGHPLEMLADERAWHGRGNRLKRAANFGRGIRLRIECFELAGAAPHEEENTRLRAAETADSLTRRRWAGEAALLQKRIEPEADGTQAARLQNAARERTVRAVKIRAARSLFVKEDRSCMGNTGGFRWRDAPDRSRRVPQAANACTRVDRFYPYRGAGHNNDLTIPLAGRVNWRRGLLSLRSPNAGSCVQRAEPDNAARPATFAMRTAAVRSRLRKCLQEIPRCSLAP